MEVDLGVERPGEKLALVEIKSTESVRADDVRSLEQIAKDIPDAEAFCLSLDKAARRIGNILCLPWEQGVTALGL